MSAKRSEGQDVGGRTGPGVKGGWEKESSRRESGCSAWALDIRFHSEFRAGEKRIQYVLIQIRSRGKDMFVKSKGVHTMSDGG
jgi:hypothetical protein